MIADAYGWTLPEIFALTLYQTHKLIQAIQYRSKQEHKQRIIEIRLGYNASKKSLLNYLSGKVESGGVSILADSGFEKRTKK